MRDPVGVGARRRKLLDAIAALRIAPGEIFDDVQNVAARAQALTDPGSVVVTARVRHQFALSVVEERGSHELKGVPEPVTLLHMVKKSRSAAAAARSGGVSPYCVL